MWSKTYKGIKTREISFPVGGIGTGSIGMGGDGRFHEWEIANKPDKARLNGFSHIAVKAEKDGKTVCARVLNGDLQSGLTGEITDRMWSGFGHGPYRETMAGIPHFKDCGITASYPFADYTFGDETFPGSVSMSVFNPFIPLNADDSSIPAAFFEVKVRNTTAEKMDYTVAFSLGSMFSQQNGRNRFYQDETGSYLTAVNEGRAKDDLGYGELCLATDERDVQVQQYWYRGRWYDGLAVFWQNFTAGKLENRVYDALVPGADANVRDTCTLAVRLPLAAGETKRVRFAVTWYFPNCNYYLEPDRARPDGTKTWKNYYATVYDGALCVGRDVLKRWDALERATRRFTDAFYTQTLPEEVFDAVSANISILKSPTVLRLEDGSFYGWEGLHCRVGSCEGSCTHVWNYAYALPFLFPELERSMRTLDYTYNQDPAGGMHFRLQLPLGAPYWNFRPCCDGQFGGIVKTYRDWKLSGDDEWLKKLWPKVKKSLEYAWSAENPDMWDLDRDGVLEGRQHHTLDMELYGPNSWLTSMYLAALKAASEMAAYLGDKDAEEFAALYRKGRAYTDEKLFNGEYYQQDIDLNDIGILKRYAGSTAALNGGGAVEVYWNAEAKEIKYQFGEGCAADQQLGQWHALLCGLGDILDQDHSRAALEAVYRHNYKPTLRDHFNPCRIYATGDEATTVICDWPEGKRRPLISAPYAEEGWPGIEYQVASHMIMMGMYDQGLQVVRAVRSRFDGENRNPWNEFECGSNYSRSMSSYALVPALSGFRFDMTSGMIGFAPKDSLKERRYFWSVSSAYGLYEQDETGIRLTVLTGSLTLNRFAADIGARDASVNGRKIAFTAEGKTLVFAGGQTLGAGDVLELKA